MWLMLLMLFGWAGAGGPLCGCDERLCRYGVSAVVVLMYAPDKELVY